jgi:hypothetical protein
VGWVEVGAVAAERPRMNAPAAIGLVLICVHLVLWQTRSILQRGRDDGRVPQDKADEAIVAYMKWLPYTRWVFKAGVALLALGLVIAFFQGANAAT